MLDRLPPGSRIAVIRLRSLGDCVLTTPALSLLKAYRPDLRLAVVVEDRFASVFEGNADVELTLPPTVSAVRAWGPDAAINLHGGTRSMTLSASGARYRAGFAHHRFAFLYTHKIPTAQEILGVTRKVHTAEHVASAMFFLGVPQAEVPRAQLFAKNTPIERSYALIHPFASAPEKTWPPDRFLEVAEHIETNLGLEPIFIPGPGEPSDLFKNHRVIPNAPIPALKALMSGASFLWATTAALLISPPLMGCLAWFYSGPQTQLSGDRGAPKAARFRCPEGCRKSASPRSSRPWTRLNRG